MTYNVDLIDALITISPITEFIPLPVSHVNELDAIVLSGYHLRSYITFIKEFIPCETMKLNETPGIRQVFSVRDLKAGPQALDLFIFLSLENTTQIIVPTKPGQFE